MIAIEGSIQTRKYVDRDGKNRTAFEVVANNVQFADFARREGGDFENTGSAPAPSFSNAGSGDFAEISDADDDLPF